MIPRGIPFFQTLQSFSGRTKELLIINGENYSPIMIEEICLRSLGLNRADFQSSAYIFVRNGTEYLGVSIEVPSTMSNSKELRSKLCEAVFQATDLALEHVEIKRKGTLPKTSSGKLMRRRIAAAQSTQKQ